MPPRRDQRRPQREHGQTRAPQRQNWRARPRPGQEAGKARPRQHELDPGPGSKRKPRKEEPDLTTPREAATNERRDETAALRDPGSERRSGQRGTCTWPPQQLSELTEGQLSELPLALLPAQTSLEI